MLTRHSHRQATPRGRTSPHPARRSGAIAPGNDQDTTALPGRPEIRSGATADAGLISSAAADSVFDARRAERLTFARTQPCALTHYFSDRTIEAAQRH